MAQSLIILLLIDFILNIHFSDDRTIVETERDINVSTGEVDPAVLGTTLYKRGGDNEIFKASYIVSDDLSVSAMVASNEYERTDAGTGDAYSFAWWPYPTNSEGLASQLLPGAGSEKRCC